jgi:DNA-binding NtrC family response regulator
MVMAEGMTGLELAGRLVARRPGPRVIIASGYSEAMTGPENPLPEGATFLRRPFGVADLAQAVRDSLDRRP